MRRFRYRLILEVAKAALESKKKDIIIIELVDFFEEKFDKMIMPFAELTEIEAADLVLNLDMPVNYHPLK